MTEQEFRDIVEVTAWQFNIFSVHVEIVDTLRGNILAETNPLSHFIWIARTTLEKYDYDYLLMIARHELAHIAAARTLRVMAITGHPSSERSHGPVWRETAFRMGVFKEELHPYSQLRNAVARNLHMIPEVSNSSAP